LDIDSWVGVAVSREVLLDWLTPADAASSADVAQAHFASVQDRFLGNHHLTVTSPVSHQFLEAVRNIPRQLPTRFKFNEFLLRDPHTHLYSSQFGTFLFNSRSGKAQREVSL
jgi:myotubularin-related protein 6/7/8